MYEKNGEPLEVILFHFIEARIIRPKIRVYRTDNFYAALMRQAQAEKEVEEIVRKYQRPVPEKKRKRKFQVPEYLRSEDQKRIAEIIKKAQRDDGIPRTTQQSIPFDRMFQDGICRVGQDFYTKTIRVSGHQLPARPAGGSEGDL
jgi:hypothetical protein